MAIDIDHDDLIELSRVPATLQKRTGKRINISTCYRWINRGIASIKLETICVGGHRYTTAEALNRFFSQSTLAKQGKLSTATAEGIKRAKLIRDRQLDREAEELGI
jgi:hypothetical protein